MLQDVVKLVVDSYVSPRTAVRQVIDRVKSWEGVAIIFGLSFVLSMIMISFRIGDPAEGGLIVLIINLLFSAGGLLFLAFVTTGVGKFFGGQGDMLTVTTAFAWHSLVTVIFSPFLTIQGFAPEGDGGPMMVLQFAMLGAIIYLMVNFVAEAHRFASAWKVAGVMAAIIFIPAMLMSFLFAGSM